MSSDPYVDVVTLVLVLAAALLVAAVIWLLVRKYRTEHSMDCTPPKLASPRSTPMLSSTTQLEEDLLQTSPAPMSADKEASAVRTAPTPTVDTSHVLSRDLSTTGKSPNRPRDASSRPDSDSRSRSGSYGRDRNELPATPLDHAKEQALVLDVPQEQSRVMPHTEPMGAYRRDSRDDVGMKIGVERKALPEAETVHVALGKLSVPGDHAMTRTSSEVQDRYKVQDQHKVQDQRKERHLTSREVRKRKSRKTSHSSVDKSTLARRQRKHHLREAPSAVDEASPAAFRQPELTSRLLKQPVDGALIATVGSITTAASSAVAATSVRTTVVSTDDALEVRNYERPSRKSRGGRSQSRKSKGRSSITSIPAVHDANGKPPAAERGGAALPTTTATPAASLGKTSPDAAAQDPFKTAASSVAGSESQTPLPCAPAVHPSNAMTENTASHPTQLNFSTPAQSAGEGADDLYKMAKASSPSSVRDASEADIALLASASATTPAVKTSADDLRRGVTTHHARDGGLVTSCLAEAPVLETASSSGACSLVDKKEVVYSSRKKSTL